jgi:hypothetical protein
MPHQLLHILYPISNSPVAGTAEEVISLGIWFSGGGLAAGRSLLHVAASMAIYGPGLRCVRINGHGRDSLVLWRNDLPGLSSDLWNIGSKEARLRFNCFEKIGRHEIRTVAAQI